VAEKERLRMEIWVRERTNLGWKPLAIEKAHTPDAIIAALRECDGRVAVRIGGRGYYRSMSRRGSLELLTEGKERVKQLDEAGFKAALEGWEDNEGPMLEALENVFEDKLRVNSVNFSKDAGGG
jgi:hypothetical protein